jgi:hypothetical protein
MPRNMMKEVTAFNKKFFVQITSPNFGRRLTGEQENIVNFAGTAVSYRFNFT